MFAVTVAVTAALGAALAVTAAARYRLPVELVPALIVFAVFAGTVPAWADGVLASAWPAAVCLVSAVVCFLAAAWAVRSRMAQLLPGWGGRLQREVEAESAAEDVD